MNTWKTSKDNSGIRLRRSQANPALKISRERSGVSRRKCNRTHRQLPAQGAKDFQREESASVFLENSVAGHHECLGGRVPKSGAIGRVDKIYKLANEKKVSLGELLPLSVEALEREVSVSGSGSPL